MSMTVSRRKDNRTPKVFMHQVADIRGGVSVKTSELGGDYIKEGAVLTAPDANGQCHVVKVGDVYAAVGASETTVKIKKFHNFKVGDFILIAIGGLASTITAIDTSNKDYDTLTIDQALGAIEIGGQIVEAAAKSTTTTSALKYTPFSLVGTGKEIEKNSNFVTDAWVFGVTKGNPLPSFVMAYLKGIVNY